MFLEDVLQFISYLTFLKVNYIFLVMFNDIKPCKICLEQIMCPNRVCCNRSRDTFLGIYMNMALNPKGTHICTPSCTFLGHIFTGCAWSILYTYYLAAIAANYVSINHPKETHIWHTYLHIFGTHISGCACLKLCVPQPPKGDTYLAHILPDLAHLVSKYQVIYHVFDLRHMISSFKNHRDMMYIYFTGL